MSRSRSAIFLITTFNGSCDNLQMYPHIFSALAPIISEIYIFKFLSPKVGQGHDVQLLHSRYSMENVKIYKCLPYIYALALAVSDINFFNF